VQSVTLRHVPYGDSADDECSTGRSYGCEFVELQLVYEGTCTVALQEMSLPDSEVLVCGQFAVVNTIAVQLLMALNAFE
jgi:hypothetical protein